MNVFIRMTYINSSKPEAKHTDVEAKDLDFVTLDWRELLLHFYRESEEHYKNITETKEIVEGMKGIKSNNDSTSPSPLLCTKELVE
jgi:hypothetical protein